MYNFNSKQGQDRFVYKMLGDIRGYFIDVGAYQPVYANNTYFFEQSGWDGISFELVKRKWDRRTKCFFGDVTKKELDKVFLNECVPKVVDYMSVDVDEATLAVLNQIPFTDYTFKIMTIEHDFYRDAKSRGKIREILYSHGYQIYHEDILLQNGKPFEDWWVHPNFFRIDGLPKTKNTHWKYL